MDKGHWVLLIVLFIILGLVGWYEFTKKSEIDNYAKGSTHNEVIENNWPLSIHPCGALFAIIPEKKNLINSAVKK